MWYRRVDLAFQYDYRGVALANIRVLVCSDCRDVPQAQLKALVVPADPMPVINPRVEFFVDDETGQTPVIGVPTGLDQNAVMPFNGATLTAYRTPLHVLSVTSNGTTTVSVTCSASHRLSTGGQVAVEGLSDRLACGFFSVTVGSATAFTYQTATAVPAASLATPTTLILTALVGLPYATTQIPQV